MAGVKANLLGWDVDSAYLHSRAISRTSEPGSSATARFAPRSPTRRALYTWRIGDNANLNSAELYAAISPKINADGKTSLDLIDIKGARTIAEVARR